jgi:hypothetical protein
MLGGRPFTIHSCCNPSSGVNLFFGSHSRHLPMKFTNDESGISLSLFIIYFSLSSFYSCVRISKGAGTALSLNYVNNYFLYDLSSTLLDGMPMTSIINYNYSIDNLSGSLLYFFWGLSS